MDFSTETNVSYCYDGLFTNNSVSVYVHWPFCPKKCPYCSFNSYAVTEIIDFDKWLNAYIFAIREAAKKSKGKTVRSIYFGGGSPALLPTYFVSRIINEIEKLWGFEEKIEITVEFTPGISTERQIKEFKDSGVNRASIGIQSLNEDSLSILGRSHSPEQSLKLINHCLENYDNVTIDIIYAIPSMSIKSWEKELTHYLTLGIQHLSLYQLVIEDSTIFGEMYHRGELLLPDEDSCARMFEVTQELTDKAGFDAYEVSNHAKEGFKGVHNLGYWLYHDYVGIGAGAHSRITLNEQKYAFVQDKHPNKWIKSISENNSVLEEQSALTLEEQSKEAIIVGLRMTEGIKCSDLPLPLGKIVNKGSLEKLVREGYMTYDSGILKVTGTGMIRLTSVTNFLLK